MTVAACNPDNEFRVMTSGGFTAAYKLLIPELERLTHLKVITVTTSIGTGDTSIPNRLKRGEIADLVICSDNILQQFIAEGSVLAEGQAKLARSIIGFAVRAGAPKPDIETPEALRDTLLRAASIGYSASESGKYITTQLYQRLGIAEQVLPFAVLLGAMIAFLNLTRRLELVVARAAPPCAGRLLRGLCGLGVGSEVVLFSLVRWEADPLHGREAALLWPGAAGGGAGAGGERLARPAATGRRRARRAEGKTAAVHLQVLRYLVWTGHQLRPAALQGRGGRVSRV